VLQGVVKVVSDQYIADTHGPDMNSIVCCSLLQVVAVCCSVLQCVADLLQFVSMACCSVLWCVAGRLQCVAVYNHSCERTRKTSTALV